MEPYYVIFSLPDEEKDRIPVDSALHSSGKTIWYPQIRGPNEGDSYGELVSYELPKQQLVFGPIQVEGAEIDQEPDISQQLSLWISADRV